MQKRTIFGAQQHRYELKPTVSERQVVAFEKKINVAVPPGLRAFYTTIGDGGAGPFYGDAGATVDEMTKAMTKLLPPAEAFRARHEVDDKLRGLAPRST